MGLRPTAALLSRLPPHTSGGGCGRVIIGLGLGVAGVYVSLKAGNSVGILAGILAWGAASFWVGRWYGRSSIPAVGNIDASDTHKGLKNAGNGVGTDRELGADFPYSSPIAGELRERRRIAAVLHDDLQQTLAAARLALEIGGASERLDALIVAAIDTTRSLARSLEVDEGRDLGAALRRQMDWSARWHRLKVVDEGCPTVDFGVEVTQLVVAIVAELLFNVARHAPAATVRVRMEVSPTWVFVDVIDDGPGMDLRNTVVRGGLGAARSRLRALGGELDLASELGAGLRVTLCLPRNSDVAKVAPG